MPKSLPERLPESVRNDVPSASPDFRTELAAQLAELVPEAVADGRIDAKKLVELLGDDTADESERFGLFWPGKKRALRAAQAPTTATLKPDFAHSKDWDTTENVFIEGDNLEVLKILQRHYHNKVKLIYIDPPYNTGKDFVYPDNFTEGLQTYFEWTRQVNEEGRKVSSNPETAGRFHSNWLNMMYPRLKLARNLLTDDGVIFISIDDNEVANLRRLCDEVFGESNFIATFAWESKYTVSNDAKWVSGQHEYVLCYAKVKTSFAIGRLVRTEQQNESYRNPDNDPKGEWKATPLHAKSGTESARYDVTFENGALWKCPQGRFPRYSKQRLLDLYANGELYFNKNGGVDKKTYLSEVSEKGVVVGSVLYYEHVGHTHGNNEELAGLLGKGIFDNPKGTKLLQRILRISNAQKDAIVLDFFAGSGTTAHAVMQLNAEDGGNRRFIMVQLPEPTPEDSEARKAGFATIADISRKRIALAGEKIGKGDTGFRAYKLTDTHFAKWRVTSEVTPTQLEQHLLDLRDSADDEASQDDLLTELLLKLGHSLSEAITTKTLAGLDVREVGDNQVLAFINEHTKPTLEQLRALVDAAPGKLVVLEDAFHGDDQLKTNLAQYAKTKGIELRTA